MLVSSFNLLDSKAFKLTKGAYAATRMNSIGDLGCYGIADAVAIDISNFNMNSTGDV